VPLLIPDFRKGLCLLQNAVPAHLPNVIIRLGPKHRIQELFAGGMAVKSIRGVEQLDGHCIGSGRVKNMGLLCEPIDHFRAANRFWAAPGVDVTGALKLVAVLLDAHVTKLKSLAELVDGEPLSFFQSVNYSHSLRTANFAYSFHRSSALARQSSMIDLHRISARPLVTRLIAG